MSFLFMPFRHSFFGFSRMMVSIILIGELSVAVFALPALPNTWSTSGTVEINLSCICNNLFASEFETSGKVTGINNSEPSSKGGINSEPNFVIIKIPVASATRLIPIVVFPFQTPFKNRVYSFSSVLVTGLALSGFNLPFRKKKSIPGLM